MRKGQIFLKFFSMSKVKNRIKNMKKTDWLILVLLGVLILIVAIPTGSAKKNSEKKSDEELAVEENQKAAQNMGQKYTAYENYEDYEKRMEQQLEELLGAISGVGRVKVMVTFENMGEDILDKDMDTDTDGYRSSTVLYDCGDYEAPYVIRSDSPKVQGVVVVCEGGGDSIVVSKISAVIESLFSVEMHKITVVKMSVSEGTN